MTHSDSHTVKRDGVVLVVIDVQERLAQAMPRRDEVVAACRMLVRAAGVIGIPVIATRQYPDGIGPIVPELADLTPAPVDKITFDCMAEPAFVNTLEAVGRRQVVLTGMEAHICVAQTGLALLSAGYGVQVVADAVCSRRDSDRDVALDRLRAAGAEVTSAEAIIYEALGRAGSAEFKSVLTLVKERDAAC